MKTPLNIGIIGLGVGMAHLRAMFGKPSVRVLSVYDPDPGKQSEATAGFPGVSAAVSAEALIADPQLSLVVVASPDQFHFEQAQLALKNGKHVFVEKPLCSTRDEAEQLHQALASQPNARLCSNLILRLSPRFLDFKQRIGEGQLGSLYYLEADYNYGRLHKLRDGWRGADPNYSVTLGGGIHMIDLAAWLVGSRVARVSTVGNKIASKGFVFPGKDLEVALLEFENGVVGKVASNFGCTCPHFHRMLVYGTEGVLENRAQHALLTRGKNEKFTETKLDTAYPGVENKGALLSGFVDSLLTGTAPPISSDEIFGALAVCFAIQESLRIASPVTVSHFRAAHG